MKKIFAGALVALGVGIGAPGQGLAQDYPSRPIKFVVPFAAGGPLDFVARALADKMSASLKQTIVIENRLGAAGNLGTDAVAKAAPDGYTLLVVLGTTLTVNPGLYKNLPFDPQADFRPISILTGASQMLVVHPSVPVNSVSEFVAHARKNPVNYAHAGYGSPGHLVMEAFRLRAEFPALGIPYKGNSLLVTDLLAGQVKVGFVATAGVGPHVRAGRLKGLATSAQKRSTLAPDVPTVDEAGYPGFEVETWFVMLAPAGTPEPIAARLESEVQAALKLPDIRDKFLAQDITPVGSTAAAARARIGTDTARWTEVIKAADMRLQ